jgi:hypothetical protein
MTDPSNHRRRAALARHTARTPEPAQHCQLVEPLEPRCLRSVGAPDPIHFVAPPSLSPQLPIYIDVPAAKAPAAHPPLHSGRRATDADRGRKGEDEVSDGEDDEEEDDVRQNLVRLRGSLIQILASHGTADARAGRVATPEPLLYGTDDAHRTAEAAPIRARGNVGSAPTADPQDRIGVAPAPSSSARQPWCAPAPGDAISPAPAADATLPSAAVAVSGLRIAAVALRAEAYRAFSDPVDGLSPRLADATVFGSAMAVRLPFLAARVLGLAPWNEPEPVEDGESIWRVTAGVSLAVALGGYWYCSIASAYRRRRVAPTSFGVISHRAVRSTILRR